jgi:hypothetical protein
MLNNFNIKWTNKFSVYDYLKESDAEVIGKVQFPDGTIQKKFKNEDLVPARYSLADGRWQNNDNPDILNFRVII